MATERILYTDGHDVTVTDSTLRVRKHAYQLDRIYQHRISIFKPNRTPGLFFIGLGLINLTAGTADNSFQQSGFSLHFSSLDVGANAILITLGIFLMVSGIVFMIARREKYGMHIVTAYEEKDVLVSKRREYVATVEEALNKALVNMLDKERRERPTMSTSHR